MPLSSTTHDSRRQHPSISPRHATTSLKTADYEGLPDEMKEGCMITIETLLEQLRRAQPRGQGQWSASCPTSIDKLAALSVGWIESELEDLIAGPNRTSRRAKRAV